MFVEILDAIDRVPYREGNTLIGQAIQYLIQNQLLHVNNISTHPTYVFIITDGESQDDPTPYAEQLKTAGISIIVVGVTKAVSELQLKNITEEEDRTFFVNNFISLNKILATLISHEICTSKTKSYVCVNSETLLL